MQSVKALESGGSEHEVVGSAMSWTLVVWRIWWIVALWQWRLQSVKALESGGSEHEVVGSAVGTAFALALPMG